MKIGLPYAAAPNFYDYYHTFLQLSIHLVLCFYNVIFIFRNVPVLFTYVSNYKPEGVFYALGVGALIVMGAINSRTYKPVAYFMATF